MTRYTVRFFVNSVMTCAVENVPLDKVYSLAVPSEVFQSVPGNRWHAMLKWPATTRLGDMQPGERMKIAWQEAPSNPELDMEEIFVECEYQI